MAVASEDREAAKLAYDAARRDLREFREGRAAKTVFRSLDPVCCPRCDEMFDEERKQASAGGYLSRHDLHSCSERNGRMTGLYVR